MSARSFGQVVTHPRTTMAAVIFAVTLLVGCATAPTPRTTLMARPGKGGVVAVSKHHKPHPHAMWVKGHYAYKSGRYVWVPGHWKH